MSIPRIVCGLDGSSGSAHALEWAAHLVGETDTELVAVTALVPSQAELPPDVSIRLHERRRGQLEDEWCAPAQRLGVTPRPCVVDGDPRQVLADTALNEGADALVVGAVGQGAGPGLWHLGSVVEHIAHHIQVPLVVIPDPSPIEVRTIVLGVDGSADAIVAARWTRDVAVQAGASVVVVAVEEPVLEWTASTSPKNWRRFVQEQIRDRWAAPLFDAALDAQAVATRGMSPAAGLLAAADEYRAELLVVGMRGAGGFAQLRVGGVAMQLLHRATLPVSLVAPAWRDQS